MNNSNSPHKNNKMFKWNITFSGIVRFFSVLILIYIIDFFFSFKGLTEQEKWKLIIITGGIEILFFFSITKVINLLISLNKLFDNKR